MAITSITRDWGFNPALVRITSTDNYSTVTADGYLTAQAGNIALDNQGSFEWQISDAVLMYCLDGWFFLHVNPSFTSLFPLNSTLQTASVTLTPAQVLAAFATPQLLISAPGASKVILASQLALYTNVSTAFSGGGIGIVQYGTTVHGAGVNALSATIPAADITAATSQVYVISGTPAVQPMTAVSNLGLYFSNATGAFAGGAGSSLTFNLSYKVINALV